MGEAVAELFAAEGACLGIVDVQRERGEQLAARIAAQGGAALFVPADVAQDADVARAIGATVARFGGLHMVINCAGVVHVATLDAYAEADWDQLMGVNLKSIYLALRHALPHLRRQQRSYVVNIGSVGSFVGQRATPAYTASKHAVLGLTRSIALDYAADGLRCNCVCPGITDTPMLRYHLSTTPDPEATLATRLRRVPTGVALGPADVARAVLYLSCEDSAGITGTSLVIDGGYTTAAEWETTGPTRFAEAP
jgi:NAD(P)-dependent dehydrogenase (short-subunit alcohol dehydrogenase family)